MRTGFIDEGHRRGFAVRLRGRLRDFGSTQLATSPPDRQVLLFRQPTEEYANQKHDDEQKRLRDPTMRRLRTDFASSMTITGEERQIEFESSREFVSVLDLHGSLLCIS